MGIELRVLSDRHELSRAAADEFVRVVDASVAERDGCSVALSGGSTPKEYFTLLATDAYRSRVPWNKLQVFWGDERHVGPDDPQSNYRMAREALLSHVPLPAAKIHRVPAELADAQQAAASYEQTLRTVFAMSPGEAPRFDLVFLGLGPDGHTASLFPSTKALGENERWVVAPWVEKLSAHRITFTPPMLNRARRVVFVVSGAEKAPVLREVLEGPYEPERVPAEIVRPEKTSVLWLVDADAAHELTRASRNQA